MLIQNKKAHFDYEILEQFSAGLELFGHEVKSLRGGKASIEEGLVRIDRGEIFLFNVHIPPYEHLSHLEYNPTRSRKLLMHRSEIERLGAQVQVKGLTLIPLELYFKGGKAKVRLGLCTGKTHEDRRQTIKERETKREMDRVMRKR